MLRTVRKLPFLVIACAIVLFLVAAALALAWRDSIILRATPGAGAAANASGGGTSASLDLSLGGTIDQSMDPWSDGAGAAGGVGQSAGTGAQTFDSSGMGAPAQTTGSSQTTGTTGQAPVPDQPPAGGQTTVVNVQGVSSPGAGGSGQGGNGQGGNGQGGGGISQPGEGTATPELPSGILMLLGLIPLAGAGLLLRRRRGAPHAS